MTKILEQDISKEIFLIKNIKEILFEIGLKSLTMDEIAKRLNMSKKTLYIYFSNKASLIDKIVDYIINEQKNNVGCISNTFEGNAIDEMVFIYQMNIKMMQKMKPDIMLDLKKYFPESHIKIVNFKKSFIYENVKNNIKQGKAEGLYRDNINIDIIAKIYSYKIVDAIISPEFPKHSYDFKDILTQIFLYHLHGLCSDKGNLYLKNNIDNIF